jgi:glycerol-3-phosphate dehydrogenase
MHRDPAQLTARTFDILVIGGGVYGLTVAYDAAQRGLSVALIEREDFGSGASFNHLRTIHGGLRYLQHLDVTRARESVRERRTIARIAPHVLRALPFAVPLYRSIAKGRAAMRAGFVIDRMVAAGRNTGVPYWLQLPAGRVVSRGHAIERFPGLRRRGLTGAAIFYDYVTTESDRLTLSWALAASQCGATLANHVEATAPLLAGRRVTGAAAVDRLTGAVFDISATLTINATGGRVNTLAAAAGISARVPMLKAMNLVTRRDAGDEALGGRAASGRHLFLVPWRRRALFGTWESAAPCEPGDCEVTQPDIAQFIRELNEAFPALDLSPADVTLVHQGVVPAAVGAGGRATLEGRQQVKDHADEGVDGLITVAGTKYTTARATAERIVDLALRKLKRAHVASHTAERPLPGGHVRDIDVTITEARRDFDALLPSDTIPHIVAAYGSRYREVLEAASGHADWHSRVAADSPVIGGEIVWAARHEMAMTLADAVIRRTPLGALGYPGDAAVARAADLMAAERHWTPDAIAREIAGVRQFYQGSSKALKT